LGVVETPALKQAKEEITRLNEELELRVVQRTAQLTAANEELRAVIAERRRAEAALHEAQRTRACRAVMTMGEMAAALPTRRTSLWLQSLPKVNPACAGLPDPRPTSPRCTTRLPA